MRLRPFCWLKTLIPFLFKSKNGVNCPCMGENIPSNRNESVVCVGASLVDLTFRCDATPVLNTSNPATMHRSPGGVVMCASFITPQYSC